MVSAAMVLPLWLHLGLYLGAFIMGLRFFNGVAHCSLFIVLRQWDGHPFDGIENAFPEEVSPVQVLATWLTCQQVP